MWKSFTLKVSLVFVIVLLCVGVPIENARSWESPTDESLWCVWCSGYGWWAVGGGGTILWWNPAGSVNDWEVWPRVTWQSPNSVFMRAKNDGWMVGGGGGVTPSEILHYDGKDWRPVASGTNMPLSDVWAISADDAWAVGQRIILRWNGISWNTHTTPSATLWAIHMVSATEGWAVGGAYARGGVIFHWDGTSWEEWPIPEGAGDLLLDVYMVDANDGWATGADGTILRWNGVQRSWQTVTSPTSVNLYGVTMTTADSGWAVGGSAISSGDGTVIRWDGTRWRPCTIQTTEWTLRSVDMVSDAVGGWAVGDAGTMIRLDKYGYYGEVAVQYELTIDGAVGSGTTSPLPGSYWHDEDTDISVDAQPASGWMLDHWLLDGVDVGSADPYSVTMDADHTLTAVFTQIQHQLTISVTGSGTTNPSPGSHMYNEGTDVSVDAQPASGWQLDHWELDGVDVGATDPYSVTMDADHTLRAVFVRKQHYITVTSDHGSPTPSQWVDEGESLTVSVTSPADDDGAGTRYRCTGYRIDDGDLQEGTSHTFENVQAPHEITFEWTAQYQLTVDTDPSGLSPQPSTSPSGPWYDDGTQVTLTAETVSGYTFDHWTVDGASQGTDVNPISVEMDQPHYAIAHYTPVVGQCSLTIASSPVSGVSVTVDGSIYTIPYSNSYPYGTTLTISAPPSVTIEETAYTFDHWADDQGFSSVSTSISYEVPSTSSAILTAYYISAEDTIPPTITHTPITTGNEGQAITITATVADDVAVTEATLCYRKAGETAYTIVMMTKSGDTYTATIPASAVTTVGVQYYINATDGINFATDPATDPKISPHTITISAENLPPTAVTLNDPSNITENSMKLTWTANDDVDFARYEIYLSTSLGTLGTKIHTITDQSITSYTVTGLSDDTTYYFTIRVVDTGGLSADSSQVSGKTKPAFPLFWLGVTVIVIVAVSIALSLVVVRRARKR